MRNSDKSLIYTISLFVIIVGGIIGVLNYFNIHPPEINPKPVDNDAPFNVSVEPSFIEEGTYQDYNGIPIKFILTFNPNKNITSLTLNENAVIVDRENRTTQTKVSSIYWTKTSNSNYVFYKDSYTYSFSNSLEAEGKLWECENCFMGEDKPYIFTFNFIYTEGSIKKTQTSIVKLPII